MKLKRVLFLLLAMAMVFSTVAAGGFPQAFAEEFGETGHAHCICGGEAIGNVGDHASCAEVAFTSVASLEDWNSLTEKGVIHTYKFTKFKGTEVNIVLTGDVTLDNALEVAPGQTVNICLMGHTLTSPTDYPLAAVYGGTLNITDCTGNGSAVTKSPTAVYLYSGASLNIYGGTVTTSVTKKAMRWGLVNANGGQFVADGVYYPAADANFAIYGGTLDASGLTLSTAAVSPDTITAGGAVWCSAKGGNVAVYGGTVKGAAFSSKAYNGAEGTYYAKGGAIAVTSDTASFTMTGGTVIGGNVANGLGGAVYLAKGTANAITGGTIEAGKAVKGAAIYKDDGSQPATYETNEIVTPVNFTPSLDGTFPAMPAGATELSDSAYVVDSYVLGDRQVRVDTSDLSNDGVAAKIGRKVKSFTQMLTLHPTGVSDAKRAFVTLDVSGLDAERFYSVVGISGERGRTDALGVIFSLYGGASQDGEFTLLATSGDIHGYESGVIDADISGYDFLKLTVNLATDAEDYYARNASWCDVCVYSEGDAPADMHRMLKYNPSADGTYIGHAAGTNVVDLTDPAYVLDSMILANAAGPRGVSIDTVTLGAVAPPAARSNTTIGAKNATFAEHFTLHPTKLGEPDAYALLDLSSLDCDRLYSIVGIQGGAKNGTTQGVVFAIYGAATRDGEYDLLASSGDVFGKNTGEFDLDITGYKYIKLVTGLHKGATDYGSRTSSWCNVTAYKALDGTSGAVTADLSEKNTTTTGTYVYTVDTNGDHVGEVSIADASRLYYLSDLYNTGKKAYSFVTGLTGKENSGKREFRLDRTWPEEKSVSGTWQEGEDRVYVFTNATTRYGVGSNSWASGRPLNGVTYYPTQIVLGPKGTIMEKGLSFMPTNPTKTTVNPATVVYDLRGMNVDRFYALAGMTGEGNNPRYCKVGDSVYKPRPLTFEVWGSKSDAYTGATFEKLASIDGIETFYTGEFNVNISGYNFLKLVSTVSNLQEGTQAVWANACVYSLETVDVPVRVKWNNGTNTDLPTSVNVTVSANGTAVATETLTEADGWKTTLSLPKYVAGTLTEATYTVDATAPADYDKTVDGTTVTMTYTAAPAPVAETALTVSGAAVNGEQNAANFNVNGVAMDLDKNVKVEIKDEKVCVTLTDDVDGTVNAAGKDVYLDLAGKTMAGTMNVGTLYGIDATTNGYTEGTGKLTASVTGTVASHTRAADAKRYLASEQDGVYTFNRFYIGITSISMNPYSGEIGYKAIVGGNESVKAALADTGAYGFKVGVEGFEPVETTADKEEFVTGNAGNRKSLTIENQLKTVNEDPSLAPRKVTATVFIRLANGDEIESSAYSYTMEEMYKIVDDSFDKMDAASKNGLKNVYKEYAVMKTWDLPNIAAYAGK